MREYTKKRLEIAKYILDDTLQIYKRTGEIKTAKKPYYKGKELSDVYKRYSEAKKHAYQNCMNFLSSIGWEFVTSYGITSSNCFSFNFCATVELENRYVILFSSSRDNISYYGDKYNSCFMTIKTYLLED